MWCQEGQRQRELEKDRVDEVMLEGPAMHTRWRCPVDAILTSTFFPVTTRFSRFSLD